MAPLSTRCGTGWGHHWAPMDRPRKARMACEPNHTAVSANPATHTWDGRGFSRATSIPAIATPMTTWMASPSSSVCRRHSCDTTSRLAQ